MGAVKAKTIEALIAALRNHATKAPLGIGPYQVGLLNRAADALSAGVLVDDRHMELDREFLQQVADSYGVRQDQITADFLATQAKARLVDDRDDDETVWERYLSKPAADIFEPGDEFTLNDVRAAFLAGRRSAVVPETGAFKESPENLNATTADSSSVVPETEKEQPMKYVIEVWNGETGAWEQVHATDRAVRLTSNQFASHIVFETDDPEYNG